MDTKTPVSKKKQSSWSWNLLPEELAYQVKNYSTLKITESVRGQAVLLGIVLMCISVVLYAFGVSSFDGYVLTEGIIYVIALFFIYKGHRWAIILVMILWTLDKAVQLFQISSTNDGSYVGIIIWWLIFMPYLYKALRVENERRKDKSTTSKSEKAVHSEVVYCGNCGSKQNKDAKFCNSCGEPLN